MDKMNYNLLSTQNFWGILQPDQITSFSDSLFMPSVWKNGRMEYWG
jgi:hypothetical protein